MQPDDIISIVNHYSHMFGTAFYFTPAARELYESACQHNGSVPNKYEVVDCKYEVLEYEKTLHPVRCKIADIEERVVKSMRPA